MVSKLNPEDFRSYRLILDPDDFALGDEEPDPPPTDLVSREVWEGIMTLPGDVAIRTTSHQGTRAAVLHELWGAWIDVTHPEGIIAEAMAEGGDELEAALFNLLHGFYKQAIAALRSAIEVMTLGCVCEIATDTTTWTAWENGGEIWFKELCDKAQRLPAVREYEDEARRKTGTSLFAGDNGSGRNAWARNLYRRISGYSHTRGTTTNSYLWQSNGPVYSAVGFQHSYNAFLETYVLLLFLAKLGCPGLIRPREASSIDQIDSRERFLAAPFRALAAHYTAALFGAKGNPETTDVRLPNGEGS